MIKPNENDDGKNLSTCNRIIIRKISAEEKNTNHAFVVGSRCKEVISPEAVKKMFGADF